MTRRIVFVTSGKGGVTKTKFARFLAELHRLRGNDVLLVDADRAVGQFLKHLGARDQQGRILNPQPLEGGVISLDWHNDVRGRDAIADVLAHGKDLLIDMPGGSLDGLHALDESAGLLDVARDMGFEATFVSMITPWVETWADSRKIRAWFPAAAHLLVVNRDFGSEEEDFADWNESETRKELLTHGSREIVLPYLEPRIAARIAKHRLLFHDAATSEHIRVLDRGRAKKWISVATAAVEPATDILSLATAVPA